MVSRRPELLTSLLPWNKPHRFDSALCLVLLLCITSLVAVSGSLVRLQDGSLISSHLSRSLPRHGVTFVLAITEVRDVQPPKQSDGAIKQLSNLWTSLAQELPDASFLILNCEPDGLSMSRIPHHPLCERASVEDTSTSTHEQVTLALPRLVQMGVLSADKQAFAPITVPVSLSLGDINELRGLVQALWRRENGGDATVLFDDTFKSQQENLLSAASRFIQAHSLLITLATLTAFIVGFVLQMFVCGCRSRRRKHAQKELWSEEKKNR